MQDYPVYHEEGLQSGARNFGIPGEAQGQPSNHQPLMYQSNGRNVGIATGTPQATGQGQVRILNRVGVNPWSPKQ